MAIPLGVITMEFNPKFTHFYASLGQIECRQWCICLCEGERNYPCFLAVCAVFLHDP